MGQSRIMPECHVKALCLMAEGLSDKEISARLNIRYETARVYISLGRQKLGLTSYTHTRTQAAFAILRMIEAGELTKSM
jgi:DNA-binding NarL/FixJ family response regulator